MSFRTAISRLDRQQREGSDWSIGNLNLTQKSKSKSLNLAINVLHNKTDPLERRRHIRFAYVACYLHISPTVPCVYCLLSPGVWRCPLIFLFSKLKCVDLLFAFPYKIHDRSMELDHFSSFWFCMSVCHVTTNAAHVSSHVHTQLQLH